MNNMDINPQMDDAQLLGAFSSAQDKTDFSEILKELFDTNKIELITELTGDEIRIITRLYMISKLKKITVWNQGLLLFMKLKLSQNRQSRKEIIDAVKGYNAQRSMLSRLNPFNRTGGQ